jgi:alanine racemase
MTGVAERTVLHHRPTVAVIDLDAVRHNARALAPARAELMAVVKANAYGHGDGPVARAALQAGATWLGVALVEEGVRLRHAGIDAPILVLSESPPGSEEEALAAGLTVSLYTRDGLRRLVDAAARVGATPGVHVKVDTGMHRVGLPPEQVDGFVRSLLDEGIPLEGLWTHFATSEEPRNPATVEQLERFRAVADRLSAKGIQPRYLHAANTGAILAAG